MSLKPRLPNYVYEDHKLNMNKKTTDTFLYKYKINFFTDVNRQNWPKPYIMT